MRPWRVPSEPGGPLTSRPQRQSHSLKPASQPAPPFSIKFTNPGLTGRATGDFQPSSRPSHVPRQSPMPRVGRIETDSRPLLSSTTSTPSETPPRNAYFSTDQASEPANSKSSPGPM